MGANGASVTVRCPVCGSKEKLETLLAIAPALGGYWGDRNRLALGFRKGEIRWACEGCVQAGRALRASPSKEVHCLHPPYLAYYDDDIECEDCGQTFTFSAEEQRFWYEELQFLLRSRPKQCAPCRRRRRERKKAEAQLGPALAQLTVTPKEPQLLLQIADLYLEAGRPRKSAEYLRRAKNQVDDPTLLEELWARIRATEQLGTSTAEGACTNGEATDHQT
jgi:hypothetical protein